MLGLMLLAGCMRPAVAPVPSPLADPRSLLPQAADAAPASPLWPQRWWQLLGDPELDRLIGLALSDNPGLRLSRARIERALAVVESSRAGASVQAGASGELGSQRYSANGLIPKPIAGNTWDSAALQAALNWSPDLFGQHAAELAAAVGQARATQADAAAAAHQLAVQITRAWVSLARVRALAATEKAVLGQREQALRLTQQRVQAGLDERALQAQAQAAVSETRRDIETLEEQARILRRQLAVLCALPPEHLQGAAPDLEDLRRAAWPSSYPLDLLGRRPEVVAARWRVEASVQDVALARSQFYPNINLSAFVGFNSLGLGRLLEWGSRQPGASAAIRLPLFDGGRLKAQLGLRQADLEAAIAGYNQAIFDAVREVADAQSGAASLLRQDADQAQALQQWQLSHELAERRFKGGLGNYLAVLSAQAPVLQQQRQSIDLKARQIDAQVLLMKALGGAWQEDLRP